MQGVGFNGPVIVKREIYKFKNEKEEGGKSLIIVNLDGFNNAIYENCLAIKDKLNSLCNPHIIKYFNIGAESQKNALIINTEYCDGVFLQDQLKEYKSKNQKIPEDTILKYIRQILSCIGVMHDNDILHGPVNSKNILVDTNGDIKLFDFEFLKDTSGEMLEVLKFEDFKSLGCLCYELCTLKPLHLEDCDPNSHEECLRSDIEMPKEYSENLKDAIVMLLMAGKNFDPEELLREKLTKPGLSLVAATYKEIEYGIGSRKTEDEPRTLYYSGGGRYEGELKESKRNGYGVYFFADGTKYIGEWKEDEIDGEGTCFYVSGDGYRGGWKKGRKEGKGEFRYANGNTYIGDWKDDKKNGIGRFCYTCPVGYTGSWKDDKRHGKGVFCFINGLVYDGDWEDDRATGRGILYHRTNKMSEEEARISEDKIKESNGFDKEMQYCGYIDRYEGEFKDGHFHGKGKLNYNNGNTYEGKWKDDIKDGKGIFSFYYGRKYELEWKNGGLINKRVLS